MARTWINGFPKHGNYALCKGIQLLGIDCEVNHETYPFDAGALPRIFIKRDPRNALVSWLRFNGQPVTQGMFITHLGNFEGQPLIQAMASFEGWLSDPGTLVVKYEDLIANDVVLRQIANYLDTPYLDDAFPNLLGNTVTWRLPPHADYTTIWTQYVQQAWTDVGGNELLTRWGY